MGQGILPRDENNVPAAGAISVSDADLILPLEIDDATGRLLVSAIITGGSITFPTEVEITNDVGTALYVRDAAKTTVYAGEATVVTPGTDVPLAATTGVTYALVQAKSGNVGSVFVGNGSTQPVELVQLAAWAFTIDDLSKIRVDATNGGDGVNFTAG
jgi:hypothetical protein